MSSSNFTIEELPNEIFATILAPFCTKELLPLVSVSHRFHSLVTRILHRRLLDTAGLPNNELMLECYHPSAKISTPSLSCRYLGVKTRDGPIENPEAPGFTDLRRLYSSFRPVVIEENRRRRRWFTLSAMEPARAVEKQGDETATEEVHMDDGELFSQLCAVTNVVKLSPKRGFFVSHVNISDGVIRVWREWLANRVNEAAADHEKHFVASDGQILWVDTAKTVGLRFKVTMGPSERMPLISGPGDDFPVSYTLVYEEMLVQTSKLLLAVEKSAVEEIATSGKAIIIAAMDDV